MESPWQLHIVSHTHWDREWYIPFQQFRVRLVALVEQLLAILAADPEYKHFMLDGQTVLLEDYLEIQPHRRAELEEMIANGRVLIGPWYTMPELSLVGGEAIVRNLLHGRRIGCRFGGVMPVGYLPDAFGQIRQMPQILRGFGIDAAVVWRGVDDEIDKSEFIWQGPEGSEVLTVHLPNGYSNAFNLPTDPQQLQARLSHIRKQLQPLATTRNLLLMNGGDHAEPQPELSRIITEANKLFPDAVVIQSTLPEYIAAVRRDGDESALRRVQGEFRSGRHNHILAGVLSARMWLKQRNFACETALEKWAEPFAAVASVLLPAEVQQSHHLATGKPLLETAWRYLLHNHAHDTIAGCGIDQLYHEARTRFDWSEQTAEAVTTENITAIAEQIDPARLGEDQAASPLLAVFNGNGQKRTDIVRLKTKLPADYQQDFVLVDEKGSSVRYQITGQHRTDILSNDISRSDLQAILNIVGEGDPGEWPQEKIEALESMVAMMAGEQGPKMLITGVSVKPTAQPKTAAVEISTAETGTHNYEAIRHGLHEVHALLTRGDVEFFQLRVWARDEIEIAFLAEDVPAFGYRAYRLLPGHRALPSLPVTSSAHTIQNEFFSVQVNPLDGTLTVIDKETGAMFEGLNAFVDGGDAGDEYNYSPPAEDLIIATPGQRPRISLVEEGPVRSLMRVELELNLPIALRADRRARVVETVSCPVVTEIALYQGVRRIDVRTEVDNRAADHRLRVHFPTRLKADHSHAEGHFLVVERPVSLSRRPAGWIEEAAGTHPQKTFVDLDDGKVGFLLANRGLPEFEALTTPEGTTLALTLLRSVGWLSRDDLTSRHGNAGPSVGTPEAQCLDKHLFEYALVPHAGDWETAYQQAHWFAAPLRAIVVRPLNGSLPSTFGLVSTPSNLVVISAVKGAEENDGIVVRLYNPSAERIESTLRFGCPVTQAWPVNLNEEKLGETEVVGGSDIRFAIRPAEVMSFKVKFTR